MRECRHCDTENDDATTTCVSCGRWVGSAHGNRVGNRFVLTRDAVPPRFCVRCGEPVTTEPASKTFTWHHPAWYLAIAGGVILYVVVALVVRKQFALAVPICDAHLSRRRALRWTALGLLVLAVAGFLLSLAAGRSELAPVGCVVASVSFIASIVVFLFGEQTVRPTRIDDDTAEFAGACPAFLARLG